MTAEPTRPIPLDQALAELDSEQSVNDRHKRAAKRAEALVDDARGRVIWNAGTLELSNALLPLRSLSWSPSEAEVRRAEIEAGRGVDALVLRQCEVALRAEAMAEIYRDPDRQEAERIWWSYANQVSALAFRQGNNSERWIAKFRRLIEERTEAELNGDPTGPVERRLDRHVGYPYPQLPEAAWIAADSMSEPERTDEYLRLQKKYGPRTPPDAPTGRRARK